MTMESKRPTNVDEVMKCIAEKGIKYIRLEFYDINGIARSKLTPSRHFKSYASNGASFSTDLFVNGLLGNVGEGTPLVKKHGFSDTAFFPYFESFVILPWLTSTARVIINPLPSINKNPKDFSPISVAENQLKCLKEMGITLLSAFEFEFWLANAQTQQLLSNKRMVQSTMIAGRQHDLFVSLADRLTAAGIDIEAVENENALGQFEVTYKPKFGLEAAIDAITFRIGMKEMCFQKGIIASFMSKPWPNQDGCSAHLNHSLWNVDQNVSLMHDPTHPDKLSDVASHWLAGLVTHAPALSVLCTSTSNCFLRLTPGTFAPTCASWGFDSRISAIRVKSSNGRIGYLEQRMPASASNPFVSLAATIAAGIDGVKRKLTLLPPVPTEATEFSESLAKQYENLPRTLEDGLRILQEDSAICEALGSDFIGNFVVLREGEASIRNRALADGWNEFEWGRKHFFEYI